MIQREKKEWGVRVSMQPLGDRPSMTITAEVNLPKGKFKPETFYWFDGPEVDKPLRLTDLTVWQQGLSLFLDAVKDVQAQMMKPAKSKRKKKH